MDSPEKFPSQEKKDLLKVDLQPLIGALEEYNRQFGFGALLAEAVSRAQQEAGAAHNDEKKLSVEELSSDYFDTLEATGLSLEPARGNAAMFTAEGEILTSVMRLNLKDGRKFVHYLQALENQPLEVTQIRGLIGVAKILETQLATEYDLTTPDERMLELFSALDDLVKEYGRLDPQGTNGLKNSTAQLAEYLSAARAGYLREYLIVEKRQFLDEIGGMNFGPSKWHTDSSPGNYANRWREAIEIVKNMRKNSRAADFSGRVIEHLKKSIGYAEEDLKMRDYISAEATVQMKSTLHESLLTLQSLEIGS